MKSIQKKNLIFILKLVILNSLFVACNFKTEPNGTSENIDTKVDTTKSLKWLNFTSGIQSIFEDSEGNLWFGSNKEGVALYNKSSITYFTTEDGLTHNQVLNIQEDQNGIIWFETGLGVCSYDGKSISEITEKSYNSIHAWALDKNDLWFKGDKGYGYTDIEKQPGAYRYHGDQFTYLVFPIKQVENVKSSYSSSIQGIIKGQEGRLWFGTYEAAIGYDGKSFNIIGRKEMGRMDDSRNIGIRALLEDSKGNLWIGDNGGGVYFYNRDKTINFTELHNLGGDQIGKPTLNHIVSIGEDHIGNIWFGTYKSGVWRFDGESLTNFGHEDGLNSNSIKTIYMTKNGTMLFGGKDPCAVYKFNGTSFEREY